jgi:hypothetical protein
MSCPEILNTKVIANELRFLLDTHMVLSDAWYDSCGLLKSGQSAELVWTDWTYG